VHQKVSLSTILRSPYATAISLGRQAREAYDSWFDTVNRLERQQVWSEMAKRNSTRSHGRNVAATGGGATTAAGSQRIQASDLALTRHNLRRVPSRVPRNIGSQIVFDVVRVQSTITTSLTGIVETNFSFTFNSHPENAQWAALFDQWCIPQFSVTITNTEPPGSLGVLPILSTAIDFDNTTNLGSSTLLLEFENSQQVVLGSGMAHTRACHPCVKLMLASSGSSSGVDRMWCDSANPGGTWFGFRSIVSATPTATTVLQVTAVLWFAFRSGI